VNANRIAKKCGISFIGAILMEMNPQFSRN